MDDGQLNIPPGCKPTVAQLNIIQAEWMKLSCDAPQAEKNRVFKLMEHYPKCYVSAATRDGLRMGIVIFQGQPLNMAVPLKQAVELCESHHGRTDVFWQCPNWVPAKL